MVAVGGGVGGTELREVGFGIELGREVWTLTRGGGGGTRGTLSGAITLFSLGVAGVGIDGEIEAMGPGAGGAGAVLLVLCDPGSTTASESCMLGFVFRSLLFELEKKACNCQ